MVKQLVGNCPEWETESVVKGKWGISGFLGAAEAGSDKCVWGGALLLSRELREAEKLFQEWVPIAAAAGGEIKLSYDRISPWRTSLPFLSCLPSLSLPPGRGQEARSSRRGRQCGSMTWRRAEAGPCLSSPFPHHSSWLLVHSKPATMGTGEERTLWIKSGALIIPWNLRDQIEMKSVIYKGFRAWEQSHIGVSGRFMRTLVYFIQRLERNFPQWISLGLRGDKNKGTTPSNFSLFIIPVTHRTIPM